MASPKQLKTWVEVSRSAVRHNIKTFRSLIGKRTKLFAVVKSNAYGHGIAVFSTMADEYGVDGFCVDSVVEGAELRKRGITKPILVLGVTLPELFAEAEKSSITITISSFEHLKKLARIKKRPPFHVKIDTGMHRQGIYIGEAEKVAAFIRKNHLPITGIYTHFASAKDSNNQTYTEKQFNNFTEAIQTFGKVGLKDLMSHAAATGGTLMGGKYQLDTVRVGIGLYGLWPSKELTAQLPHIKLRPVLSWRTIVSEIKPLKKGECVGYDLSYRAARRTQIAVLPVGYWHGLSRALSDKGSVLIRDRKVPLIGKISMDMAVVDVGGIPCKVGDRVTIIGASGKNELRASDLANSAGTIHYEIITRLNPLIERIVTR